MAEESANSVAVKIEEAAAPVPASSAHMVTAELRASDAEVRFFVARSMCACSNDSGAEHDGRIRF